MIRSSLLYSRRLGFLDGQPLVTVRVLEGREEATIRALGPLYAAADADLLDGKSIPESGASDKKGSRRPARQESGS